MREADRLAQIVDDLLDLSQIEAQEAPSREPLPVALLVVRSGRPRAGRRRHGRVCRCRCRPRPPDVEIRCDHRQLRSALVNLLDNAIKYSGPGETGRGRRAARGRSRRARRARPRHRHPRLATSNASSSASTASTGLGAATPAAPASASRSCATSPRRTVARSRWTRAKAKAPRSRSTYRSPTAGRAPCRRRHDGGWLMADPPLILVVDDEQSYRDALSVALQREGFLVETAADGMEAVIRFDATKPALVLLDVMLPKMSGIDVCRELRTRSPRADHHGDRAQRRDRRGRRARGRRRRLRHQAVPPARAHCAGARGAAARSDLRRRARPPRGARGRRRPPRRRAPRSAGARRHGGAAAQGVRAARAADGERRPRAHPRRAHRPHLGPELLRRHQDARRAHQATAIARSSRIRRTPAAS